MELAILDFADFEPNPGSEVEAKKPKKSKREKKLTTVADNFKLMLMGIFSLVGERNSVWQVHESELDLIVEPGARIFNRYISDKTEEYSDIAIFITGILILTLPRIILTIEQKKEGVMQAGKEKTIQQNNVTYNAKFADAIPGDSHIAL